MTTRRLHFSSASFLGLLAVAGLLALLGAADSGSAGIQARAGTIRYVAPSGSDSDNDCSDSASPCRTAQHAVDQAGAGDEVRLAAGVYTDTHARPRIDVLTTGLVTQVLYVSKTVTIKGGYNADWSTWAPDSYTSTLDAQRAGRVLYITGDISSTIIGLRITGGDATGLGGGWEGPGCAAGNAGGGVYVISATVALSGNHIFDNRVDAGGCWFPFGGGLYLVATSATLVGNEISDNSSGQYGGGIGLDGGSATLRDNEITDNDASLGGGLCQLGGDSTIDSNLVRGNSTYGDGGGLLIGGSGDTTLSGNTIMSNSTASNGGGLSLGCAATVRGNTIIGNEAESGGGLVVYRQGSGLFFNNVIIDNQADTVGSGFYIMGGSPRLWHTTIAGNSGGDGSAIFVSRDLSYPIYGRVEMTNTILVDHSVGISVTGGSTATVNGILWHGTPITLSASITASASVQNQSTGDPAFDSDGYHLTAGSAAIDAGVGAGIPIDIDGQERPEGGLPDLGADEYFWRVYLPLVIR